MSKFIQKLQTTIVGGAIIIGLAQVVSRLLGLLRDRLLASNFGAGDALDIYYAAFKLPDLIFNIIVLGALSSAFIPVFLDYWHREKEEQREEAWNLSASIFNILLIALIILGAIIFIFAPAFMYMVAPGFEGAKRLTTAQFTRVMLLGVIFFGLSNVLSGILNSFKRFIAYSLAPIMYNVGIIFGIEVLVPTMGNIGLAWGVVLGAFLHMIIQLPAVLRAGFKWKPILNLGHKGVKQIGKLMVPRTLGLAVAQINQLVITVIASTLIVGSVAIFNLANNLQSFPISVVGISLAVSAFPHFSQAFSENNVDKFVRHFSKAFRRILYLIIPVSILILPLRAQLVRIILGTGNFDWTATVLTADVLGLFALSLFAQSLIPLLARSFYAFQNTKTPVTISIVAIIINIAAALLFIQYIDSLAVMPGIGRLVNSPVGALAAAFSLSSLTQMILLIIFLRNKIGDLDDKKIVESIVKIIFGSVIMILVVQVMKGVIAPMVNMQTFLGVFLQASGAAITGLIAYFIVTIIIKSEEINILREWFLKAKRQLFNNSKY